MTGLIDKVANVLVKKDRADEAVRKSKQKEWGGEREILVSSSLCGAGRRTSSDTNHAVRVITVTRKTTLGFPRLNKIRKVSSAPSEQAHGHSAFAFRCIRTLH